MRLIEHAQLSSCVHVIFWVPLLFRDGSSEQRLNLLPVISLARQCIISRLTTLRVRLPLCFLRLLGFWCAFLLRALIIYLTRLDNDNRFSPLLRRLNPLGGAIEPGVRARTHTLQLPLRARLLPLLPLLSLGIILLIPAQSMLDESSRSTRVQLVLAPYACCLGRLDLIEVLFDAREFLKDWMRFGINAMQAKVGEKDRLDGIGGEDVEFRLVEERKFGRGGAESGFDDGKECAFEFVDVRGEVLNLRLNRLHHAGGGL